MVLVPLEIFLRLSNWHLRLPILQFPTIKPEREKPRQTEREKKSSTTFFRDVCCERKKMLISMSWPFANPNINVLGKRKERKKPNMVTLSKRWEIGFSENLCFAIFEFSIRLFKFPRTLFRSVGVGDFSTKKQNKTKIRFHCESLWSQGDQTSLWKICPKWSPTLFCHN
jgi:hypothetical protein